MPRYRFHGEVDDLLPAPLRGRVVERACARDATVKHALEALGVPHTEIGEVHVGGRSVRLDDPLHDADEVDVYPPVAGIREPGGPLDAASMPPPRFLADAHLGGLARRLRLLGFDTELAQDAPDHRLAERSDGDGRILLSRDRELLKHRRIHCGRFVRAVDVDGQIREVIARYELQRFAQPFTRCLECNGELGPVAAGEVAGRLPQRIAADPPPLTRCSGCRRVYWPGSHWRRLAAVASALLAPAPMADPARTQAATSAPAPAPARDRE